MQICTSHQKDNHASISTGRMPFLPPTNSIKALKAKAMARKLYCSKTADWTRMPFGVVSGEGWMY